MEISNKASKAITITVLALTGTICLGFLGVGFYCSGALFGTAMFFGALFGGGGTNADRPFASNGHFIYENVEEYQVHIQKMEFTIKKFTTEDTFQATFKHSKNIKYGINIDKVIYNDVLTTDFSFGFAGKNMKVFAPHSYDYEYNYYLIISDDIFAFSLKSFGEDVGFYFKNPRSQHRYTLSNQISNEG